MEVTRTFARLRGIQCGVKYAEGFRPDLIKTRVIDGEKYILISAEGDIEVNGINISIT